MKTNFASLLTAILAAVLLSSCNRDEPSLVAPPAPTVLTVKMNEVYSRGDSAAPDWIEIYNPNTTAVVIGGYKIYDSGGQSGTKAKKEIPAGTSLPANGFYVITVDTADASGFGISSSGETVWFENASGTIIDSVVIPALGADTSYARTTDGGSTWGPLSLPTRGKTNSSGGAAQPVVLNEIFSRGIASDPDWVEIYNPNDAPVTIGGYTLYDGAGNSGTKPKLAIPAGTTVAAKGYAVIVVDVTTEAWGFGLGSGGDEIWLENSGGTILEHVTIPAMPVATTSYSRVPNGSATWVISNTITKGAVNQP
ncbi:MAG: lamin tail domain-containing protein [Bacteroidetes bacterium]|nr:lamin tail domain-containing protein [Bacteroidota bacterium]